MSLKIRLARGGAKKRPFYRIVVADKRYARDGRYLEKLGTYDPRLTANDEKRVILNKERITYWMSQGAKPSDRVARFLAQAGMIEMPKWNESPSKSAPSAKTRERIKEKEEKAKAAVEAAAAEKAAAAEAAAAPAPAEEATEETAEG
mgnify:CR=1 FL=1